MAQVARDPADGDLSPFVPAAGLQSGSQARGLGGPEEGPALRLRLTQGPLRFSVCPAWLMAQPHAMKVRHAWGIGRKLPRASPRRNLRSSQIGGRALESARDCPRA